MGQRKPERKTPPGSPKKRRKTTTKQKGDILETVVQEMLGSSSTTALHNQHLPTVVGDGRTRQIDVLLVDEVWRSRRRRIAECKNEVTRADTEHIDAVVGKAIDVGVPSQNVLYVTTNGYTEDALKRAKAAGIRTLVLRGLSEDRLERAITKAQQIVVYIQLVISQVNLISYLHNSLEAMGMSPFGVSRSSPFVTILDEVRRRWVEGRIPDTLGESDLEIPLKNRLIYVSAGREKELPAAKVKVRVVAHLVCIPGEAVKLELVEVPSGRLERVTVDTRFLNDQITVFASPVETESALSAALQPRVPVHLVLGRQRLPRITCLNRFYWPVSVQSLQRLRQLERSGVDPTIINVAMTEGLTIQTFFEDPAPEYMVRRDT